MYKCRNDFFWQRNKLPYRKSGKGKENLSKNRTQYYYYSVAGPAKKLGKNTEYKAEESRGSWEPLEEIARKQTSEGKSESVTQMWNKLEQRRNFWTHGVTITVTIEIHSTWLGNK